MCSFSHAYTQDKTLPNPVSNIDQTAAIVNLKVFPNPVIDKLNVTSEKDFYKIEILDLTGKRVSGFRFLSRKSYQIDTNKLPSGTYVVHVYSEGNMSSMMLKK
jgi:hypothetical protein